MVSRQKPVGDRPTSDSRTSHGPNASAKLPSSNAGKAKGWAGGPHRSMPALAGRSVRGQPKRSRSPIKVPLMERIAREARRARARRAPHAPPLSPSLRVGANDRLGLVLDGEDAVADGEALKRQVHQRARAFVRHDLEMIGLAADHDAERDESAEAAASRGQGDRAGELQRAGHGQRLVLVPRGFHRGASAGEQQVVEVRIEARFDEKDGRHDVSLPPLIGRSSTIARP